MVSALECSLVSMVSLCSASTKLIWTMLGRSKRYVYVLLGGLRIRVSFFVARFCSCALYYCRQFLWEDMPCAYLPFYPDSGASEEELKAFRLSSKSHWDVPIEIDGEVVHFLAARPPPPGHDRPEDRNGKLVDYDEIRIFAGEQDSEYINDDGDGNYGGIRRGKKGKAKGKSGAKFVIAGDYNADPFESGFNGAATRFADNPLINNSVTQRSLRQGDNNLEHCGPAIYDTADFSEAKSGNIRVDYGKLQSTSYVLMTFAARVSCLTLNIP
jgi:hypothetical protein